MNHPKSVVSHQEEEPISIQRVKDYNEPQHEISTNVVYASSKGSDQPAHTRSLIRAFASRLDILRLLSY